MGPTSTDYQRRHVPDGDPWRIAEAAPTVPNARPTIGRKAEESLAGAGTWVAPGASGHRRSPGIVYATLMPGAYPPHPSSRRERARGACARRAGTLLQPPERAARSGLALRAAGMTGGTGWGGGDVGAGVAKGAAALAGARPMGRHAARPVAACNRLPGHRHPRGSRAVALRLAGRHRRCGAPRHGARADRRCAVVRHHAAAHRRTRAAGVALVAPDRPAAGGDDRRASHRCSGRIGRSWRRASCGPHSCSSR